jgi:hypothetical protein
MRWFQGRAGAVFELCGDRLVTVVKERLNVFRKPICFLLMACKESIDPRLLDAKRSPGVSKTVKEFFKRHLLRDECGVGVTK